MSCEHAHIAWIEYLEQQEAGAQVSWEAFLTRHPGCEAELNQFRKLWQEMDALPEVTPSPELAPRFYAMLEGYQKGLEAGQQRSPSQFWQQLQQLWQHLQTPRWAYAFILFGIGIGLGLIMNRGNDSQQIAELSEEVRQVREVALLSLLNQNSVGERLQAVSLSYDLEEVNQTVTDALLQTLREDPSVNVRLSTIEALRAQAHDPRVRQGLIQAISGQESPLVLLALAETMVILNEKGSLPQWNEVLEQEHLQPEVKEQLRERLEIFL